MDQFAVLFGDRFLLAAQLKLDVRGRFSKRFQPRKAARRQQPATCD
jgi:hypothetical protein